VNLLLDIDTKSSAIISLEKVVEEYNNDNGLLKEHITQHDIRTKQQNNHMTELQNTVQNLDNKIKQNKSKEE